MNLKGADRTDAFHNKKCMQYCNMHFLLHFYVMLFLWHMAANNASAMMSNIKLVYDNCF